jgi:hypothetical protein
MGKRKSKARGAPGPPASVEAKSVTKTDIIEACQVGNLLKLRGLKRQGICVVLAKPSYIAAQNGHVDIVRYLVAELGVNVNQASKIGATPLYYAAQEGNLDMVRCLVRELGADVNQA